MTQWIFQSTLPSRGETKLRYDQRLKVSYFNPLSLHGERLSGSCPFERSLDISIHSPLTGRDIRKRSKKYYIFAISIHSPLTGRDRGKFYNFQLDLRISIHSPLTGRDAYNSMEIEDDFDFNPLSPHGERHGNVVQGNLEPTISIHSPLTGRDDI